MPYDLPDPDEVLFKLDVGRDKLGKANAKLKEIGNKRAEARGKYYSESSKRKVELLGEGNSAAASDAIADGENSELLSEYKRLDAEFETQSKHCKHISAQLNALQTIINGLKSEWNTTGD